VNTEWPPVSISGQWLSLHGLAVVVGLLVYVLGSHSLRQRRQPAAAIAWVLFLVFIPYLALPLYLLFGTRKLVHFGSLPPLVQLASDGTTEDAPLRQLAAAMGQPPVASYQKLRIHTDGAQALRALWELIDSAERELSLSTFILRRDAVGDVLVARLTAKARAGVRVRLLLDAMGRVMSGSPDLQELEAAGVRIARFVPLWHSPIKGRFNLRYHRKLAVADGERLWCGGRNLATEYFEGFRDQAPWQDLTFDLRGALARQAGELLEHDWAFATGSRGAEGKGASGAVAQPFAQIIASGPDQADDTVHALLLTACFKARTRIVAATAYFLPGDALLTALCLAARRGVDVDLVLPGRSNHPMADLARHRALRDLVAAGARVWLVPYMLHAKAVVIDDGLALAGSANLDARSLFLNYELMIAFYAAADVRRFAGWIEKQREGAERYEARAPGLLLDLTEGLVLWLAFQL
jgi:cardiolipin synthase